MILGFLVGLLINCICRIFVLNCLGFGIKEIGVVVFDCKLYSLKWNELNFEFFVRGVF